MQARMQNQNIGGYKIFKFIENAKFYFLSKPDRALQNGTHGNRGEKCIPSVSCFGLYLVI